MAPWEPKGAINPLSGLEAAPIPLGIGDSRNEVRVDSSVALPRGENERGLLKPLAMRYGMKPAKLPA
jgi:hypothetical protein